MAWFEVCPICGSDDVSGNPRRGRAACEACGFSSGTDEVLPVAAADELAALLPTPLAITWSSMVGEPNPRSRLHWMTDVAEVAVRWVAAVGVAESLRGAGGALPASLSAQLRDIVTRPTLGRWLQICRVVCDHAGDSLSTLYADVLKPFFSGGDVDAGDSFLATRNALAHGGGMSGARATELTARYEEGLRRLVEAVGGCSGDGLVVAIAGERVIHLRGAQPRAIPRPSALSDRDQGVWLVRQDYASPMLPVVLWAPVRRRREPQTPPEAAGAVVQLYARAERERLTYTPIGADAAWSYDDHVATFRSLFRLDEEPARRSKRAFQGHEWTGFLREARAGDDLIGRRAELAALKTWVKSGGDSSRLGWVFGGPGTGKSTLLAQLAADYGGMKHRLVYYHQFRVGDARSGPEAFMRLLASALAEQHPEAAPLDETLIGEPLRSDVAARLGVFPDPLLVIADGVDEGERLRPGLCRLLADLAAQGGDWLLAGRPEPQVTTTLTAHGAEAVFVDGLPPMTLQDIRAMLLAGMGGARHALVALDRDDAKLTRNDFVDAVARAASGLPIYVRNVIDDLESGQLTVRDAGALPPGLTAYYDRLLSGSGLSDVRRDLPVVAAALSVCAEPLDLDALGCLLAAGDPQTLPEYTERASSALAAASSLVRATSTSEGRPGFQLYHVTLRDHLLSEDSPLRGTVLEVQRLLSRMAARWGELPEGTLRRHLFRCASGYDLAWGGSRGRDAVRTRLTDFAYLMARIAVTTPSDVSGLVSEYEVTAEYEDDVRVWSRFMGRHAHLLRRPLEDRRVVLLEAAMAHADSSPVTRGAEAWLERDPSAIRWLRRFPRSPDVVEDGCVLVLEVGGELIMTMGDPEGRLWTRDLEGAVGCWDLQSGMCLARAGDVSELSVSPPDGLMQDPILGPYDGGQGAVEVAPGTVVAWESLDLILRFSGVAERRLSEAHANMVIGVMRLDDKRFLSWAWDGELRIWSSADGVLLAALPGHTMGVFGCRLLAPDRLLSWSQDGCIRIWDLVLAPAPVPTEGHRGSVHGAIALGKEQVLTWGDDGRFLVWSARSGTVVEQRGAPIEAFMGAEITRPDLLLAWDAEGQVHLRSADDGDELAVIPFSDGDVLGAALLDGGLLTAWDSNGVVVVWQLGGEDSWRLGGHEAWITSVQMLSDGSILVTSGDGTMTRWSLSARSCLRSYEGHDDAISGALELPDGRLVSHSSDGEILVWAEDDPQPGLLATLGHDLEGLSLLDGDLAIVGGGLLHRWTLPDLSPLPSVPLDAPGEESHRARLLVSGDEARCGGAVACAGAGIDLWLSEEDRLRWSTSGGARPLLLRPDGIVVAHRADDIVFLQLMKGPDPLALQD